VPTHKETYLKTNLHTPKSTGKSGCKSKVCYHPVTRRLFFFMYLHTVQLTWDNQKKSNDSAFIQLGEEEIVLIDQMSCEDMPLFFHKKG
jgi:hypothetical protein